MEFVEVLFLADQIARRSLAANRERMTAAAFGAWLSGAGGKKSWLDFIQSLGLVERTETTEQQKKRIIQKSRSVGSRILKLDKPKKRPKK
jgi:hypothetical protein